MIVYLDTSSLVKLYKEEPESDEVAGLVDEAEALATSSVTHVEVLAAFALNRLLAAERRITLIARGASGTDSAYNQMRHDFLRDWDARTYVVVPATQRLLKHAGQVAERYTLRAFDAVHIVSALSIERHNVDKVTFSTFDGAQRAAARAEGLSLAH